MKVSKFPRSRSLEKAFSEYPLQDAASTHSIFVLGRMFQEKYAENLMKPTDGRSLTMTPSYFHSWLPSLYNTYYCFLHSPSFIFITFPI
ncbi:hypothetical protein J7M23_09000 [Candidatus Sumerlaeota bacterium]|nr:hypothetical protein [Candidatus Sumerlaeota bacterium]